MRIKELFHKEKNEVSAITEETCPLCGALMVDEEGLLWCDACGINNDSETFRRYVDRHRNDESAIS